MMDWYLGHDVGDLVVPKEQEYFDRLPSPDSWSQWGSCGFGNMGWPNNFDTEKIVNLPDEKPHQRMSFGGGNNEMSQTEGECSFASSNPRESCEDSRQRNPASCARPDYDFSDLMEADPMDDIFLRSLLQDDYPAAAHNHSPLSLPTQSQCIAMAADSDSANMMMEYQCISSNTDGYASVSNLGYENSSGPSNGSSIKKTSRLTDYPAHSYRERSLHLQSAFWGQEENFEVLEATDMLPSDSRRCGDDDSSVEESVLLGLEAVLSQLNDTTRLCFRDSLYRLAQRSKQQLSGEAQEESLPLERSAMLETDGQTRSTRTGTAESETNTIDRAVANLMFNKANANIHEHLPAMSSKFEHLDTTFAEPRCNYDLSHSESSLLSKSVELPADSEVPVFRQQNCHNSSSLPSC